MLRSCVSVWALVGLLMVCVLVGAAQGEIVPLGQLDLSKMSAGWGKPLVDQSVTGKTLSIAGQTFDRGVGRSCTSSSTARPSGSAPKSASTTGPADAGAFAFASTATTRSSSTAA